jgi:hypothetical protein
MSLAHPWPARPNVASKRETPDLPPRYQGLGTNPVGRVYIERALAAGAALMGPGGGLRPGGLALGLFDRRSDDETDPVSRRDPTYGFAVGDRTGPLSRRG